MLIYTKKRHPSFTQEGCLFFIYQYTDCLFAGTVVFRACKRRIIITGGVDDLLASGYDHIRRLISGITKEILMQLGHIAFQSNRNLIVITLTGTVSKREATGISKLNSGYSGQA